MDLNHDILRVITILNCDFNMLDFKKQAWLRYIYANQYQSSLQM